MEMLRFRCPRIIRKNRRNHWKNQHPECTRKIASRRGYLLWAGNSNGNVLFKEICIPGCRRGPARQHPRDQLRADLGESDFSPAGIASGFAGSILRSNDILRTNKAAAILFFGNGNTPCVGKSNELIAADGGINVFTFGNAWGKNIILRNHVDGGKLILLFENGISQEYWSAANTKV